MKRIAIWGAGRTAQNFIKYFDFEKNQITLFIDNDESKIGNYYHIDGYVALEKEDGSIPIISPTQLNSRSNLYDIIIICTIQDRDIRLQCDKLGIECPLVSGSDIYQAREYFRTSYDSEVLMNKIQESERINAELFWRTIFTDTIKNGYDWCENISLSLGRDAIGYNYAYVMCRVLKDFKPKKILELGMGQSSKILNSYTMYHQCVSYDIVEHDSDWVDFFSLENEVSSMNIHIQPLITNSLSDVNFSYQGIDNVVCNKKFDFISIDGPFRYGQSKYSRTDLVPYISDILSDDFVIMIDDYNRIGEKNMVKQLEIQLQNANIKYYKGMYIGAKDIFVIVSEKWRFLTSL